MGWLREKYKKPEVIIGWVQPSGIKEHIELENLANKLLE